MLPSLLLSNPFVFVVTRRITKEDSGVYSTCVLKDGTTPKVGSRKSLYESLSSLITSSHGKKPTESLTVVTRTDFRDETNVQKDVAQKDIVSQQDYTSDTFKPKLSNPCQYPIQDNMQKIKAIVEGKIEELRNFPEKTEKIYTWIYILNSKEIEDLVLEFEGHKTTKQAIIREAFRVVTSLEDIQRYSHYQFIPSKDYVNKLYQMRSPIGHPMRAQYLHLLINARRKDLKGFKEHPAYETVVTQSDRRWIEKENVPKRNVKLASVICQFILDLNDIDLVLEYIQE